MALLRHSSTQSISVKNLIVSEDEWLPFSAKSFDGAISCLNSHWIEDLEGKMPLILVCILF